MSVHLRFTETVYNAHKRVDIVEVINESSLLDSFVILIIRNHHGYYDNLLPWQSQMHDQPGYNEIKTKRIANHDRIVHLLVDSNSKDLSVKYVIKLLSTYGYASNISVDSVCFITKSYLLQLLYQPNVDLS